MFINLLRSLFIQGIKICCFFICGIQVINISSNLLYFWKKGNSTYTITASYKTKPMILDFLPVFFGTH